MDQQIAPVRGPTRLLDLATANAGSMLSGIAFIPAIMLQLEM
jgi:hypothetical protein